MLSKALKQPVKIKVVSTYNDLCEALAKQAFDFAFIHPAHVAFEATKTGHYNSVAYGVEAGGVKVLTTRDQDAVPFCIERGFAIFGATAARRVIKAWKDTGGKTRAESHPVPIKRWLESSWLDPAIAASARETLIGPSQSDAGKRALSTAGYAGFTVPSAELEKKLTAWFRV